MQAEITNAILSALGTVLVALIGYVAQKTAAYLKEMGVTEQLNKKKYLVDIAVNAVEQVWQNEEGYKKLEKSKEQALKLLEQNGLTITHAELDSFIEAAVKAMNDGFNSTKDTADVVVKGTETKTVKGE